MNKGYYIYRIHSKVDAMSISADTQLFQGQSLGL